MARKTSTDSKGAEVVDWIERNCTHVKGEWAGHPLKLEAWQKEIVGQLFGTVGPDGRRRYRTSLIGIPRKNGKSTLGAAIALRLLFKDGEPGAEVYSCAADREQAAIVFEVARGMVEANPVASSIAKIYRRAIVVPRTGSTYRVLSADAYTKHGLSPHGVIFDELHAQPNRELWDVLTTGQGARRQPLTVAITTAGHDRESICYQLYEYGRQIQARLVDDPTFFFRWWGLEEGEAWDEESVWERVNPNLGVSVSREFLRAEANVARNQPARENTFRRLYGNQWTSQQTRWIPLDRWDECHQVVDEESLAGRACFGGLDLASSTDIAALNWTFPADAGGDHEQTGIWRFWVPEERLSDLDARTAGQASSWVKEGFLNVTPGNVIDYKAILERIDVDARTFDIVELAYDRWGMTQLSQDLTDAGMTVVPFGQGFASMSAPTKEWERLILERRYRHGGNPVMRWMFDNIVVRTDPAGNVKIDKARSSEKVDGAVAAVMGLDRAQRYVAEPPKSKALGFA